MQTKRIHWMALAFVVGSAFLLLGFFGREVYRQAPPIPGRIVSVSGAELATRDQILDGQQVWQSAGGQQLGSIWGHGAYQAPDWSADWVHRECVALLEAWSRAEHGSAYDDLAPGPRAELEGRLKSELRTNTYDAATDTLTIGDARAQAWEVVGAHYRGLFSDDPALASLREDYAIHEGAVRDPERLQRLSQFFAWTAWACVTNRAGESYTYTNNWPHEPLIGNVPTASNIVWSVLSILLLLAAVGGLVWYRAAGSGKEEPHEVPSRNPLGDLVLTPSMRAVAKYCAVVVALFVVQVLLGAVVAHYTIEGDGFFGFPLAKYVPYSLARTWHIQTAVFWIATAFLGAGLFLAPVIGGKEPPYQRLGVNVLFGALLIVVVGSLTGEFLSIHQKLGLNAGFWFGHQGYEYVELGRVWQLALFVGLLLWLFLMVRAILPALRRQESRGLIGLLSMAIVAIGLFYGAGLLYGARSHLSVAEYWRWWVVHLWVEGFFEVFATGVLAFLFSSLGLVERSSATRAFVASTTIFLLGGIPGTFHHLYFSGTPVSITAVGAVFSALEVVPLVLIGYEAMDTLRMGRAAPWVEHYRWPIRFFLGVTFWNLVGAGLFGFLINPPVALYYMQGLNTTPVHGHTALFGVYGLLSLGLVILLLRKLTGNRTWRTGALAYSFWALNIGLALMVLLSLLPVGLLQTWASVERGLWFARSSEFLQTPLIERLRWLRIVGDSVFLTGVASLVWFTLGLWRGWSYATDSSNEEAALDEDLAVLRT
ncbi:MAG: nitric-oxide reductase large subunit [Planctomycetes bacterium]|nr:nitric-oxide reductase large subunit [Planctomycetota bacterium]